MDYFYPDLYQKSIYDINYKKLKNLKIKCLLFDLDNTCVPYKENSINNKLKKLFKELKQMGFEVILFSNSPNKRLKKFKYLNIDYNALSLKPLSYSFNKIIKKYKYKKDEICIIGDQLFTDIYGGNKVGIKTCLVDPLTDYDLFFTRITRHFENKKINKYEKKGKFKRGNYYD
ncbi:MAG: YqeG family HAD IIIA-type phosphatase [Bacilli bacterium]|nr:YqeG family HAD IIIA-type phosphatase [Bacilli bacterium]